jgi:hypothetical protein
VIFFLAWGVGRPSSDPELMFTPSPVNAAFESIVEPSAGFITCTMGMPNFFANSKSRSSCAGTAMIAPVP